MKDKPRYHGLDALRAVMLLLGVLLHASFSYLPDEPGIRDAGRWWFYDASSSWVAAGLFAGIHTYRMPTFFVLAGFFTAMLIHKRSATAMLSNRVSRIAIPLGLAIVTLIPATWFAARAAHVMLGSKELPLHSNLTELLMGGAQLQYLWFLWHLLIFCGMTAVAAAAIGRSNVRVQGTLDAISEGLILRWQGWAIAFAATVWLNVNMRPVPGLLQIELGLLPAWHVLAYHGLFFFAGIVLYQQRTKTLDRLAQRATVLLSAGVVAVTLSSAGLGLAVMTGQPNSYAIPLAMAASVAVWLAVAGCLGVAMRFDRPSATMRYLSDSSYWVYLSHMPIVFLVQAALVPLPVSGDVKLLLATALTTAACLATYEHWVRYGWLSQLLNGRRHVRPVEQERPDEQDQALPFPVPSPRLAVRRKAA